MNPFEREAVIFHTARRLAAADLAAYLDEACAGDTALRQRVETLLQASEQAGAFLQEPVPEVPRESAAALNTVVPNVATPGEKAGDWIGRYKLLQQIGEGGCGLVYMAEQHEPVRRRVALKVIKLGMDTRSVIARFEAERQALAMMDHPNIAKVLDGGATETGRPYFVMELVRGIKITKYCDEHNLSTKQRLELFVQVCRAVQHAHQKGIIHRDLKPSNILVASIDDAPLLKVIDFGIAKATQGRLTDQTLFTAFEQFIGTPAYMSPEQAELTIQDVDTRSDIYSLGVLLYELLTSKTPFDSKELIGAGLDEMRRIIREKDPVRPSTRLTNLSADEQTTAARNRQIEAPRLISLMHGDLDWIVMKCLEKDRTRRYETANGLALDVIRHLKNEPVLARSPSNVYRFEKFVRRNKLLFASAFALAVMMITGLTVSTWMFTREREARQRAVAMELGEIRLRQEAERSRAGEARERSTAEQRLYRSLLEQARAVRISRRVGYRDQVFELLRQARILDVPQKNLTELRTESVACLGDFVGLTPVTFNDFPVGTRILLTRLSPANGAAAFVLSDGSILVRELPSGKIVGRLQGKLPARDVCFSSTGEQMVSVNIKQSLDSTRIYVWGCDATGQWAELNEFDFPGAFHCLSSADGLFLTSFDLKTPVGQLVNLVTKEVLLGFDAPIGEIPEVALSSDGRLLAVEAPSSDGENSIIEIWDVRLGNRIRRIEPQLGSFETLNFSPDRNYIACISALGAGIFSCGEFQRVTEFREYFKKPSQPGFAYGQTLVSLPLYQQHRVSLWNWSKNEESANLEEPEDVYETAFAFDNSFLLTCGNRHARVYRFDATREKLSLPGHVGAVPGIAFSPNGHRLTSVGKDHAVRSWDAETGHLDWESKSLPGPGQTIAYDPQGQLIVTSDFSTERFILWNAVTGEHELDLGSTNQGRIWSAQFSTDGQFLAIASLRGMDLYKLDRSVANNGGISIKARLVSSIPGRFFNIVFAPNKSCLACCSLSPPSVQAWEFEKDPRPVIISHEHFGGGYIVQTLSFKPDGASLLTLGADRRVITLDISNQREISSFPTLTSGTRTAASVGNLSLSPDGMKLALVSPSGLGVDLWDPKTGHLLYSLPDQNGAVYWLCWSPDNRRLAVSRSNGNISIWDLSRVEQILAELELGEATL